MSALRAGSVVAGRFEIERLAKEGGMGAVYRAHDRAEGGRVVALKLLRQQGTEESQRFIREAELLERIPHPGVVEYVAHGADADGTLFLVMEWLEGEDLDARLGHETLGIDEAIGVARAVAEVLAVAHRQGIVHRDLKPANVFLVERDTARVKVLDFGIARLLGATLGTGTGMILGTPAYMPPEQARAQRDVDPRADVYAMGCVLFESLTGRPPFVGDRPMAVLARMLLDEAPRLRALRPDVSEALDDLVGRMLSKKREDRPVDGQALVGELDALGRAGPERPRAPAPRPSILGSDEQRLVSLVIVGARPEVATGRTLMPGERDDSDLSLEEAGASFGIRIESLADGSAVIAFAGVGIATDQAARAARCALSLVDSAEGRPIAVATGLGHTAGAIPIGEVIDRATELLAAPVRGVRLDEVTASLLADRFELRSEEGVVLLLAERDGPTFANKLLGRPTPCVGRDRELRGLEGLYRQCADESVARAALVLAPPGVGKSRLCGELLARLAAQTPAPQVWVGRGDPMSAGASFWLLGQALRQALGIRADDALSRRRDRVRERVAEHVAAPDRARVASFLGELVDAPFLEHESPELAAARADSMLMGDQMRRAFEDFVCAEATAAPVVLVFEDLHWGDVPSTAYVDALLRNARNRSVMALGFARPELDELMFGLWADRGVERLALGPLARRACERLVRAALPALPDESVAAMVERADGNAFFLEELVRAQAEGRGSNVPPTVLAILQARLDGLPVEARRVLRAASVFGQTFWPSGVERLIGAKRRPAFPQTADRRAEEVFPATAVRRAAIPETLERWGDDTDGRPAMLPPAATFDADTVESAPPPERARSQVEELLDALSQRELVEPHVDSRLAAEPEWGFRHALVQEAAYATLTGHDRTLGHRLAGAWLEEAGEREALVLAEHHERGGDATRAMGFFHEAAEQALEGNDFAGAIARAERGVSCGASGEMLGELRIVQAEAAYWKGDLRECLVHASEAVGLVEAASAPWFAATRLVATAASPLGAHDELEAAARRLVVTRVPAEHRGAFVRAGAVTVAYLLHAGRADHAEVLLGRIEEIAQQDALAPAAAARLCFTRALRARLAGDSTAYLAGCREAIAHAEAAGDVRYAAGQRQNVGFALLELGDSAGCRGIVEPGLEEIERMGLAPIRASTLGTLANAVLRLGDPASALTIARAAVAAATAQGNRRHEVTGRSCAAEALRDLGDPAGALAEATAALEASGAAPASRPFVLALLAALHVSAGRASEAGRLLDEADAATLARPDVVSRALFLPWVRALWCESQGDEAGTIAETARALGALSVGADKIRDPRLRATFLRGVPENHGVLALADRLGIPHGL